MISREQYLRDPCGTASIPYWKAVRTVIPGHMRILHHSEFRPEMRNAFTTDEPYFRLKHDLMGLTRPEVPEGFVVSGASPAEFAEHINGCYSGMGLSADELVDYTRRPVYCPELWLSLREKSTGEIVATGIGEVDGDIGEGTLEWIQVSAQYRGRGLGRFLVSELLWRLEKRARFATVSGQCNNPTNPEKLYRKCGFTGDDVWHVMGKR